MFFLISQLSSKRKRRQLEERGGDGNKVPEHLSQKDLVQLLITLFPAIQKGFSFLLQVQPVTLAPHWMALASLIFRLGYVEDSAATFFLFFLFGIKYRSTFCAGGWIIVDFLSFELEMGSEVSYSVSFFLFKNNSLVYGCAGSSLLHRLFSLVVPCRGCSLGAVLLGSSGFSSSCSEACRIFPD